MDAHSNRSIGVDTGVVLAANLIDAVNTPDRFFVDSVVLTSSTNSHLLLGGQ